MTNQNALSAAVEAVIRDAKLETKEKAAVLERLFGMLAILDDKAD